MSLTAAPIRRPVRFAVVALKQTNQCPAYRTIGAA
jgi:hypothetical protein